MTLSHLNIAVPDVAQTRAFFETYFGFECTDVKGKDALAILMGKNGFILALSNFTKNQIPQYPSDFHVGMVVDTPEQVMETYTRMKADGVSLEHEPKTWGGRGTTSFYVLAPGNFLVEVLSVI
ncbi:VOC family protein [Spirosoma aureum]|uniref:VOC family protein n=1 Tax=Spirosoma aureum TaxID=2692134 RepID=A0A6G9APQ6_9BACT|nr:VOC family protein [Spirosoma aureum]QIP14358.1 VOC family protein [Spirosoma aureum]